MTPGDVVLELRADPRLSWCPEVGMSTGTAAARALIAIVHALKPGHLTKPLSPLEIRRARDAVLALLGAMQRAERANPSHFVEVPRSSPAEFDEDEFGVGRKRSEER